MKTMEWRSWTKLLFMKEKIFCVVTGILLLILMPYLHLGVIYRFWVTNKPPVNKFACTCGCWDTIFKGSYEKSSPGYKHVYFNITSNTFKIWAITVVVMILTYETFCYLLKLAVKREVRLGMLVLFLSVLYPHYYSWWSYFNAWNDDFYQQWYHQSFFSVTELISTFAVLHLCNAGNPVTPTLLLVIIDIAVLHILASGFDQFVSNVLFGVGKWHQKTRDVGFMIPDLLHIGIPLIFLYKYARGNGLQVWQCFYKEHILLSVLGIGILWFVCSLL